MDGHGDIFEVHDSIDLAEQDIAREFNILATIHMDPIDTANPVIAETRRKVSEHLRRIHPDVTVHHFRMVPGKTHTNLIFDAVFPPEFELDDSELKQRVQELVTNNLPNHYAVVNIDRSYVL